MHGNSPDVDAIERALAELAAALGVPGLRAAAAAVDASHVAALRSEEAAAVAGAVASRRAEFATGRALLRRLLGAKATIPVGAERRPVLPAGWIASLAHDASLAVAVALPTTAVDRATTVALGVDVEQVGAVEPALAPTVLRADDPPLDPTVAFCLKEAVYKAWSTAGGGFLEHHDVRLHVDDSPVATAEMSCGHGPRRSVACVWARVAGYEVALAAADARAPGGLGP